MRTNGTLQYQIIVGGGFNDDGEPVNDSVSWSEPIRCSIQTLANNSKGEYADGKFDQRSYQVLVESANFPLDIKRIRLVRNCIVLGEYAIQGLPTPTTMHRVKIIV